MGFQKGSYWALCYCSFCERYSGCSKKFTHHKIRRRTVLYIAGNITEVIKSHLSNDQWFNENELILNLENGITEAMTFGTAKRLAILNNGLTYCLTYCQRHHKS